MPKAPKASIARPTPPATTRSHSPKRAARGSTANSRSPQAGATVVVNGTCVNGLASSGNLRRGLIWSVRGFDGAPAHFPPFWLGGRV